MVTNVTQTGRELDRRVWCPIGLRERRSGQRAGPKILRLVRDRSSSSGRGVCPGSVDQPSSEASSLRPCARGVLRLLWSRIVGERSGIGVLHDLLAKSIGTATVPKEIAGRKKNKTKQRNPPEDEDQRPRNRAACANVAVAKSRGAIDGSRGKLGGWRRCANAEKVAGNDDYGSELKEFKEEKRS